MVDTNHERHPRRPLPRPAPRRRIARTVKIDVSFEAVAQPVRTSVFQHLVRLFVALVHQTESDGNSLATLTTTAVLLSGSADSDSNSDSQVDTLSQGGQAECLARIVFGYRVAAQFGFEVGLVDGVERLLKVEDQLADGLVLDDVHESETLALGTDPLHE